MENLPAYFSGILVVLLFTSFVKILTSLSILRFGLGLEGISFGLVTVLLSFVLALVQVEPQLKPFGGIGGVLEGGIRVESGVIEEQFRPLLERGADAAVKNRIAALQSGDTSAPETVGPEAVPHDTPLSFTALLAAFLITELQSALQLGLIFILPFLVIDLVVINILAALHVQQASHQLFALPAKLLLFLVVDGWALVSMKLLGSGAA